MATEHKRRHVHTRSIRVDAFARDDGLWDVEAKLVDTKGGDFRLASGVRPAGEPVHEMTLRITIDAHLNVLDAGAQSHRVPYPGHCEAIAPDYRQLVGLNLTRDFRRHVRERLGGVHGCTHITELAGVLPTAAIQAFAGEVFGRRDARHDGTPEHRPLQIDRCHALVATGAAVERYYPRWYRGGRAAQDNEQGETG
jgi:hypothetical protein